MRYATILFTAASLFAADSIHEFTAKTIDGAQQPLSAYKGKVALIVNVASN
jgi:glutathione peroxidase-family protein